MYRLKNDIEAFRFGVDNLPDWFTNEVIKKNIQLVSVKGGCNNPFITDKKYCLIKTSEGEIRGDYGDYIIYDTGDKSITLYRYKKFEDLFEEKEEESDPAAIDCFSSQNINFLDLNYITLCLLDSFGNFEEAYVFGVSHSDFNGMKIVEELFYNEDYKKLKVLVSSIPDSAVSQESLEKDFVTILKKLRSINFIDRWTGEKLFHNNWWLNIVNSIKSLCKDYGKNQKERGDRNRYK